jgi:hypothetical protein
MPWHLGNQHLEIKQVKLRSQSRGLERQVNQPGKVGVLIFKIESNEIK